MREKVNYLRHLSVLFITFIVFFLGVFIGGAIEEARVESLYADLELQDLEYQNIIAESRYLEFLLSSSSKNNSSVSCSVLKESYFKSIDNLEKSRSKLEAYINTAKAEEEEFERLKEKYAFTQITYWILGKQIEGQCEGEFSHTILYFYLDKKECPSCEDQGVILNYVKQKLEDEVLIFALDAQKEGVIELLGKTYSIYERDFPVLVVDDQVIGFSSSDEILELVEE